MEENMFSYYGKLSTQLYDVTKPVGHSINGDIEYYLKRLQGTKGKILEPAVGSGRFIIPLLNKGYDVDGIDYSAHMLASCQKRCHERGLNPNLYEANLSQFSLPEKYEAIVMPTGSFCLIDEYDDAISVLTSFYHHLVPGGRLIVDLLLPVDWHTGEISTTPYSLSSDEGIVLENKSIEINWVNQTTRSLLKYEKWRHGKLVDTELQEFVMRWYGIEEFSMILEKIGFTHITCSADYTFQKAPSKETELVTFEAIRL